LSDLTNALKLFSEDWTAFKALGHFNSAAECYADVNKFTENALQDIETFKQKLLIVRATRDAATPALPNVNVDSMIEEINLMAKDVQKWQDYLFFVASFIVTLDDFIQKMIIAGDWYYRLKSGRGSEMCILHEETAKISIKTKVGNAQNAVTFTTMLSKCKPRFLKIVDELSADPNFFNIITDFDTFLSQENAQSAYFANSVTQINAGKDLCFQFLTDLSTFANKLLSDKDETVKLFDIYIKIFGVLQTSVTHADNELVLDTCLKAADTGEALQIMIDGSVDPKIISNDICDFFTFIAATLKDPRPETLPRVIFEAFLDEKHRNNAGLDGGVQGHPAVALPPHDDPAARRGGPERRRAL